ncbi:MAG TPA: autotransporter-associated beta strand repeat-containing protein, partial [Chthoniobacteraceae bacterium]|nr:autotransporter-associated beta strand repeat-containing protein [Chthoniobacteraceae bacterium]
MKSPVISPIQQTRPSRMPAALGVMLLTIFAASAPAIANTVSFVTGTAVDIGAAGSYTSGTLPTTANDVDFDSSITYTNPTALLLSAASLSIGTINDLNSSALVITETNNQTITLNGGSNSIGGTANDDIYVAGGASMNLDVTTIIPTALTSAYFDSAGALTVGLVTGLGVTIGDGSNATSLTFNGAGATTINGTSNFGASATGASGTVTLNNTGGGAVIFNGPIILTNGSNHSNLTVNASNGPITLSGIRSCGSGSSLTLEGGNTITINSGYVSGYGTGGLINAGSFYVTESGAGTVVNLNASTTSNNGSSGWYYTLGAGATLNFGAANSIESTLNISSATINNTSGSAIASAFSTTANTTNINSGFTWGGSNSLVLNSAATLGTSSGTAVTITANGGALLEISGSISNGSTANQLVLTNGYFELGGTNSSYSGGTVVQSGTLVGLANGSFGSGPITMGTASGAVNVKLLINGGSNANAITTAAGDTGGVEIGNGTSASATDSGLITLNTNLLVAQSSGGSISLTGTLTGSASPSTPVTITTNGPANDITLGSVQDGSGSGSPVNIVNANSGNVNLIAPGAYSGGTQIPVGSVTAAASGALGSGPVALGTSSGGASAALYVNSGIETNAITVAGTATMTIGNSTAASSTESGLIILNDNLQITQANGGSLTFTGTFIGPSVSGTAATLTFAPSASGTVYAANISDGSSPVSVTTGPGTMVFDGTNTYSGATTISGGIVDYQGNAAFDSTGGITQSSTTGAIQLQGNISSASTTTLTLSGTGGLTGATGALDNVSGNNSLANPIVIATGPTTISSDSGTLTLTGGVTGAHTLDLNAGAGSITFSSGTLNNLAIVNVGTGTGIVTINAPIGAGDTTGVTDSSTSSLL